jgi:SAM-dependent methyltransferase
MIEVICNYCGSSEAIPVNEGPDLLLNRGGHYRLVQCQQCQLIYQNPRPTLEELPSHYPDDYVPYARGEQQLSRWKQWNQQYEMRRRTSRIGRYQPQTGTLLDIGCATGSFIVAMRELGWQVQGVELSRYAAEYARQQQGLTVHTGTVESAEFPAQQFDVVTMWDVLEHVLDPKQTLAEVGRILKPNGLLVLSLPNPDCWEAKLFKGYWVGWDRPRHLHIFSQPVLGRYLDDAGFDLLSVQSFSGRLAMTLMSLDFMMNAKQISAAKWRPWRAFLYNPLFRLLALPLYKLAERRNQLTSMTVFARLRPSS